MGSTEGKLPLEVENKESNSDNPVNSNANPKRPLEETPQSRKSAFLSQHHRLKKKISFVKTIQELAKSLKSFNDLDSKSLLWYFDLLVSFLACKLGLYEFMRD